MAPYSRKTHGKWKKFSVFLLLPFLDLIVTWSAKNFLCDKKHAKIKAPFFSSFTPLSYWAWLAYLLINFLDTLLVLDHENTFRQTTLGFLHEPFLILHGLLIMGYMMDFLEIRIPFKVIKSQKKYQKVQMPNNGRY